jgi:hypothetical protein
MTSANMTLNYSLSSKDKTKKAKDDDNAQSQNEVNEDDLLEKHGSK